MDDFINPILRKKPDQLVPHIGTNDLRRAESQVVAHGVINLAHKIEEQCPGIDIIVSGILTRTDVKALSDRVSETNRLIKTLCNQNNWDFLTNSNIEAAHLILEDCTLILRELSFYKVILNWLLHVDN